MPVEIHSEGKLKRRPWGSNDLENGYGERNVNRSPCRNFNLRDQHGCGQNDTVKDEREDVDNNLSDEEETVDHVKLLPQRGFLQSMEQQQIKK